MVLLSSSDSNCTLVSLDNKGLQRIASLQSFPTVESAVTFRKTSLQIPLEDIYNDDDDYSDYGENDVDDYSYFQESLESYNDLEPTRTAMLPAAVTLSSPSTSSKQPQVLYLPTSSEGETSYPDSVNFSVDNCLKYIPCIRDSSDLLISQGPVHLNDNCKERILYVSQGEVAHCVPSQCDVVVSDKVTTCHILALRSTSGSTTSTESIEPLCSLTHLDGTSYNSCVRSMFKHHMDYHNEQTSSMSNSTAAQIDVHIMGGYDSECSRSISSWLLHLLADIADEYRNTMTMTLQTACVSCLNDNGDGSGPIGRGLALNCHTGRVALAKCCTSVSGPEPILRSSRLWGTCSSSSSPTTDESSAVQFQTLTLIHSHSCNMLTIEPFHFKPIPEANILLQLPDDVLLHYTSTSPDCEEDDFCSTLRQTLQYLNTNTPDAIFPTSEEQQQCVTDEEEVPKTMKKALSFQRLAEAPNKWSVVPC